MATTNQQGVSVKRKRRSRSGEAGNSKYAIKKAEQARGKYRPTSPFYMSPSEIEAAEKAAEKKGQA